jgi:hypothetical protein
MGMIGARAAMGATILGRNLRDLGRMMEHLKVEGLQQVGHSLHLCKKVVTLLHVLHFRVKEVDSRHPLHLRVREGLQGLLHRPHLLPIN